VPDGCDLHKVVAEAVQHSVRARDDLADVVALKFRDDAP